MWGVRESQARITPRGRGCHFQEGGAGEGLSCGYMAFRKHGAIRARIYKSGVQSKLEAQMGRSSAVEVAIEVAIEAEGCMSFPRARAQSESREVQGDIPGRL